MTSREEAFEICNCCNCGDAACPVRDKFQRLPREYFPGALGLCRKWSKAQKSES